MKDDWKYSSIFMAGEQCVMTYLEWKRLGWHAVCWGSPVENWCTRLRMEPVSSLWMTWTVWELNRISWTASIKSGVWTTAATLRTSALFVVSIMMTTLSSLVPLQIVVITTCGTTSDDKRALRDRKMSPCQLSPFTVYRGNNCCKLTGNMNKHNVC